MSGDADSPGYARGSSITVAVSLRAPAWRRALPNASALARRSAVAALEHLRAAAVEPAVELSIVLGDDELIQGLNRTYRGLDKPTNVLSFSADDGDRRNGAAAPLLLGDIVLAYGTMQREAADQGKDLADHLCHLVVHGTLHLLGYDHESEPEAQGMERLEAAILAGLGIADPYAAEAARA